MFLWSLAKVFHTCGKNCGKSIGSVRDAKNVAGKHAIQTSRQGDLVAKTRVILPLFQAN
jgi:hypothetical protein